MGSKGEGKSEVRLFFALEGIVALLAGADLYYIFHIIDEDLAVANMTGIQGLLGRVDHLGYRHLGHDNHYLYLGQ